jgi:tRNA modification GTPase
MPKPRQAVLKKLYHPIDQTILDHALVILFQGPNSFTGQDLVELQCHGSNAIVQRLLLDALPSLGCRLAEPGEFTLRAYESGKLDLVQVEALADVLSADTQTQVQQALNQLDGRVSKIYDDWRTQLISGLAHAEAVIDFGDDEHLGDYDDEYLGGDDEIRNETEDEALQRHQENVWGEVTNRMNQLRRAMEGLLEDGRRGEIIREGLKVAILGPPNAGKSSLFNLLARKDAAIVSPIAGTTRDVLQVTMNLGGVKCTLQDTAGVRSETADILELEGMKRAQAVVEEADLVVAMVDATEVSNGLNIVESVLNKCGGSPDGKTTIESDQLLLVVNKQDLLEQSATTSQNLLNQNSAGGHLKFGGGTYQISCLTQSGVDAFLDALTKKVVARTAVNAGDGSDGKRENALITRARHRQHVEAAVAALERFSYLSTQGSMAVDMAAEELRLAATELGRVTGAVDVEDVLDVLFADFCIGK